MDKEEAVNTQTKILQEAIAVLGNRGVDHGWFKETYALTAELWSSFLSRRGFHLELTVDDVLFMMGLMKIARAKCGNPRERGHYVDTVGYVALAAAVVLDEKDPGQSQKNNV